ncbi:hypothetical protein PMAYCL1PPCAC_32353, partial [Pristionchus mayeri]
VRCIEMSHPDQTETNSQWVRRLTADGEDAASDVSAFNHESSFVSIDEEGTKEAAANRKNTGSKVIKREAFGGGENQDPSMDPNLPSDESMEVVEDRVEGEQEEEEEEDNLSLITLAVTLPNTPVANEPEPVISLAERLELEAARRLAEVTNLDADVRGLIRSIFLDLVGLTSPETPAADWKNLLAEYALGEEQKRAGDAFVDNEYPRENEEEKKAAHQKLVKEVVKRYMRKEMSKFPARPE